MAFFYRDGRMKIGTQTHFADVEEAARALEGPSYFYDLDDIEGRFIALDEALAGTRHCLHYAMKANSNPQLLRKFTSLGAGVDTVSGGEIRRALEAGFTPDRIIFSGVAKTVREIEFAISNGIKQINIESPQELERIAEVAKRLGRTADVAFRMNPDVDAKTHPYITTGFRDNKFGMDESFLPELLNILERAGSSVRLRGLTMHIGSQIFDLGVMREALEKVLKTHHSLVDQGFQLDRIDVGGGLGISYESSDTEPEFTMMKSYGAMVRDTLAGLKDIEVLCEPGRILVARAGLLVGEVQYTKRAPAKSFVILDTGMHHLIRPALYGACHRILPLVQSATFQGTQSTQPTSLYDIVGPICESSDFLAKSVELPEMKAGLRLGIMDAGAYGYAMASQYNSHELPNEVCFEAGRQV